MCSTRGCSLGDGVASAPALVAHDVDPAQVVIRWHLQHGRVVIPKSATPARITSNADVFSFDLDADEMARIDALDRGEAGRIGPHPSVFSG